ncbi:unnamed protein product [Closterium sp. Naga37s-1]|nr:unnamed protein product [Closterium sp. Naga37s-1]
MLWLTCCVPHLPPFPHPPTFPAPPPSPFLHSNPSLTLPLCSYVYILTHPGVPCVFIDHLYEWNLKDPIQKLLVIRQRNGITSRSAIRIMTCSTQLYVARIGTNVDDDRLFRGVVVKLGPSFDMHGTAPGT